MPELAYLNGQFCSIADARVNIEDRGFQFADGVYEVIVFHGHTPLMLEEHFRRFENSAREIRLQVDWPKLKLVDVVHEGVQRAGFDQTMVYVQITRGTAPRNHLFPEKYEPTVAMTFKAKPIISPEKRGEGIAVMTVDDFRWSRCHIKSIALLANVLAKNDAVAQGYQDAVFIGPDGNVREASSSNIFIIQAGRLLTAPQDHTILPGITRQLVLRCAHRIDLPIIEHHFSKQDLCLAGEAFISSTTIDILPVVRVDHHRVSNGQPGVWTMKLYQQMLVEIDHL